MLKILSVPVLLAALAGAGTSYVIVPPSFRDDGAILAAMALRDSTEIQLGQMAQAMGQSPSAKAFGRTLVRDHTAHLREVRALAAKLGLAVGPETWDPVMRDDGAKALAALAAKSPDEFDGALADFGFEAHAAAVMLTEQEHLPAAQNAQVKALLRRTIGSLRAHLGAAKRIPARSVRTVSLQPVGTGR